MRSNGQSGMKEVHLTRGFRFFLLGSHFCIVVWNDFEHKLFGHILLMFIKISVDSRFSISIHLYTRC